MDWMIADWPSPPDHMELYLHGGNEPLRVIIDVIDYEWARQWNWAFDVSRIRANGTEKFYACRNTTIRNGIYQRTNVKVYLHKEILKRAMVLPPSPLHKIGDHKNGDSLDCRRDNLQWATPSMNALNRKTYQNAKYAVY